MNDRWGINMDRKLKGREYFYISSMLFGLFFGAGNLIFPVHMGQEAGGNVFLANIGFLITGVGLPFLGIIAMGISKSEGLFDMASRVSRKYAYVFTILLYLVIGPFFALPRLATTSFEIGIVPFLNNSNIALVLAIFSIVFFAVACFYARKPSKLLVYVGKVLNPLFLILLFTLFIVAFTNPMGAIKDMVVQSSYQSQPLFTGFIQGYNTLDALASLAFGIIVISTLRGKGINDPKNIAMDTVKSGILTIILMGLIYSLLAYLGAMSVGQLEVSANGGIALAQITHYYLGDFGSIVVAAIVIVACLKTAIGLISSFSETFVGLFPKGKYIMFSIVVSAMACLFANVGLTKIIEFSVPVLMFLYPLAMTLILLSLFGSFFNHSRVVYQLTIGFTFIAAIIDGLNACPAFIRDSSIVQSILAIGSKLPFYDIGMGWVVPACIGFILGIVLMIIKKQKRYA